MFVGENEGSSSGTPTQLNPIQRKKKPKRRSTGVVNLEIEVKSGANKKNQYLSILSLQEIDLKSEESGDEVSDFQHTRLLVLMGFLFFQCFICRVVILSISSTSTQLIKI